MKRIGMVLISLALSLLAGGMLPPDARWRSLVSLAEIIGLSTGICVVTGVVMSRCRVEKIGVVIRPLVRWGRLPASGGAALLAAFASGSVAALLLAEERSEERISRREMILCAFCVSVPPVLMFNGYLMLPVIGIIGWVGVAYFAISEGVLLAAWGIFFILARCLLPERDAAEWLASERRPVPDWRETWRQVRRQSGIFLRRLLLLTTPFYLWTTYGIACGGPAAWLPENWTAVLPAEMLAVIAARLGGLLAAAGTASELLAQQRISAGPLLTALLLGNIFSGVIRLIRRGMPLSLGIYPGMDGALIAGVSVGVRFVLMAAVAAILWSTTCG